MISIEIPHVFEVSGGTAGIDPTAPEFGQVNFSVGSDGYSFRMPRAAFERLARQMRASLDAIPRPVRRKISSSSHRSK